MAKSITSQIQKLREFFNTKTAIIIAISIHLTMRKQYLIYILNSQNELHHRSKTEIGQSTSFTRFIPFLKECRFSIYSHLFIKKRKKLSNYTPGPEIEKTILKTKRKNRGHHHHHHHHFDSNHSSPKSRQDPNS